MRRLALLLTVVLMTAACSLEPTQLPIVAATGSPGATLPDSVGGGGSPALDFTADTVAGGTFQGGAYAGQDLMIWFWAPW